MGSYLNVDNSGFKSFKDSEIFEDKSLLLKEINKHLDTDKNRFCVTRPRRFGKTMASNMLNAYYSKGCSSRDLFDSLKIASDENYEKHLNKHDVIYFDVSKFVNMVNPENGETFNSNNFLPLLHKALCSELSSSFPDCVEKDYFSLSGAMEKIYLKTKTKFILIIDEWDAPLREEGISKETKEDYVKFLRSIFKETTVLRTVSFAYLTGILPIIRYNNDSVLNNFDEFTVINTGTLAPFYGFTEKEVRSLCEKYNISYDEMASWYDGYLIGKEKIFNPNSVVSAISFNKLTSYWTNTKDYESIKEYITMDYKGLRKDIKKLLSGGRVHIKSLHFGNDINKIESKDDVFTLLVHLGYLTFDEMMNEVYIPNREVYMCFEDNIRSCGKSVFPEIYKGSMKLLKETWNCNEEECAKILERSHYENTSLLKFNNENSLSFAISSAYISASDYYEKYREFPNGKGFADVAFIPHSDVRKPAMVVELKWNKNVETAISQIKKKKYSRNFENYNGEVLLVGISYNKNNIDEPYRCKIEKVTK